MRAKRRELCKMTHTENPRLEDLKTLAWTPLADGVAWWKFENCWDLEDPGGYYQVVVGGRLQKRLKRHLLEHVHRPTQPRQST